MNNLNEAIAVEAMKFWCSKLPLLTVLGFPLLPLAGGLFMIILRDPEFARQMGLISTKAQIVAGVADWNAYLNMLVQGIAGGGIVLFGIIGGWVFGREYADHTIKDLLALPTSRTTIVLAKFVVIAAWCSMLTIMVYLIGLAVGTAVALPPVPTQVLLQGGVTLAIAAALTLAISTPIIFFASAGHGYLPPIGIMILAVFFAQMLAFAGWGEYFPWSIPALYAKGAGLTVTSLVIVILTGIAGIIATALWWERADQTH